MTENELHELMENGNKFYCIRNSTGEKVRASVYYQDESYMFIYSKGKSTRGWTVPKSVFLRDFSVCKITVAQQWEKRVRKVISKLAASGLWPDVRSFYECLALMNYKDLVELRKIYWNVAWSPAETRKERLDNAIAHLTAKYPFLLNENRDLRFDFISEKADAKLKSMYFGKYLNASTKEEIKQALAEKRKLSIRRTVSYDVSFEYSPENNSAWYSEEYRGCGNGHYYLALDANTALFIEDD